jgi:hypothetical protein
VIADNGVPGFGAKATLVVTIDWQDLKNATAHSIADTVFGPGLSASTARLLACDAKVIPVVLGSNSEPLDVGRCERLVTKGMRRALNTRDRGCVVCGAPPVQCDAHHLISWIDGGITAVSNLVLLCRIHHVDLHAGKWTVTIANGRVHVVRPSWADPPSRRYRPPLPLRAEPRPPTVRATTATGQSAANGSSAPDLALTPLALTPLDPTPLDPSASGLGGPDLAPFGPTAPRTSEVSRRQPSRCQDGEEAALTAAEVRAATLRTIWGEDPAPEPSPRLIRLRDADFDPWGDADADPTCPQAVDGSLAPRPARGAPWSPPARQSVKPARSPASPSSAPCGKPPLS